MVVTELQYLQDRFLISPIDKAANNICFTCKWYSIYVTLLEVGLIPGNASNTYSVTTDTELETVQNIIADIPFSNLVSHDTPSLPYIYPLPKLQKTPIKFRFIVSSRNTVLKHPSQRNGAQTSQDLINL